MKGKLNREVIMAVLCDGPSDLFDRNEEGKPVLLFDRLEIHMPLLSWDRSPAILTLYKGKHKIVSYKLEVKGECADRDSLCVSFTGFSGQMEITVEDSI